MSLGRPIYTFTDSFFECPECGQRLECDMEAVDQDEDGEIYEGECEIHGVFLVQAVKEPDETDD